MPWSAENELSSSIMLLVTCTCRVWSLQKDDLCACVLSHFSCVQLCDPMDCSLPGFSVYGILQARILECVAMPSSRGSSWPRDRNCISYVFCIPTNATWEALNQMTWGPLNQKARGSDFLSECDPDSSVCFPQGEVYLTEVNNVSCLCFLNTCLLKVSSLKKKKRWALVVYSGPAISRGVGTGYMQVWVPEATLVLYLGREPRARKARCEVGHWGTQGGISGQSPAPDPKGSRLPPEAFHCKRQARDGLSMLGACTAWISLVTSS